MCIFRPPTVSPVRTSVRTRMSISFLRYQSASTANNYIFYALQRLSAPIAVRISFLLFSSDSLFFFWNSNKFYGASMSAVAVRSHPSNTNLKTFSLAQSIWSKYTCLSVALATRNRSYHQTRLYDMTSVHFIFSSAYLIITFAFSVTFRIRNKIGHIKSGFDHFCVN